MFSIRRHDQEPFLLCLYYSFPSNLLDSPLLSGIRIISVHLSVAYVATPFHYLMPQIGIFAAERSRKCHKYTKLYEAKLVAHVIPINRPGMQSLYSYTSALYYNCRQATFHKVAGVLSRRVLLCFTHRLSIFMACLIALGRAASQSVAALAGFLGPRYFGHYTVQNSCYHFLSF